jgi:hypothetical protein
MFPFAAPEGTVTVMEVLVTAIISASILSYSTTLGELYQELLKETLLFITVVKSKPVPSITTVSPTLVLYGVKDVIVSETSSASFFAVGVVLLAKAAKQKNKLGIKPAIEK